MTCVNKSWATIFTFLIVAVVVESQFYVLFKVRDVRKFLEITDFLCTAVRSYTFEEYQSLTILTATELKTGEIGFNEEISCKDLWDIVVKMQDSCWLRWGNESDQPGWFYIVVVSIPAYNKEKNTIELEYKLKWKHYYNLQCFDHIRVEDIDHQGGLIEYGYAIIRSKGYTSPQLQVAHLSTVKRRDILVPSMIKINIKDNKELQDFAESDFTQALLFVSIAYMNTPIKDGEMKWQKANIHDVYIYGQEWLNLEVHILPDAVSLDVVSSSPLPTDLKKRKSKADSVEEEGTEMQEFAPWAR